MRRAFKAFHSEHAYQGETLKHTLEHFERLASRSTKFHLITFYIKILLTIRKNIDIMSHIDLFIYRY